MNKRPVIRFDADSGTLSIGSEPPNFRKFCQNKIFRPRATTERKIMNDEASYVLHRHEPGVYVHRDQINAILQTICTFHRKKLEQVLGSLANLEYLSFLLWQYDQSHHILLAGRKGNLTKEDWNDWKAEGPIVRRALKYLIERVCSRKLDAKQIADEDELLELVEVSQVCAEEFVRLSMQSDSTFAIFPTETHLVIESNGPDLYKMNVTNSKFQEFDTRNDLDGKNRQAFLAGANEFTLDRNKEAQDKFIGDSFEKAHGLRYFKAVELLGLLVKFEALDINSALDTCLYGLSPKS